MPIGSVFPVRKVAPNNPAFDTMSTTRNAILLVSGTAFTKLTAADGITGEFVTASPWHAPATAIKTHSSEHRTGVIVRSWREWSRWVIAGYRHRRRGFPRSGPRSPRAY